MLDIADLVIEDAPTSRSAAEARPAGASPSPLRPWGMWGGWAAAGLACAGAVAHAVALVGRQVSERTAG